MIKLLWHNIDVICSDKNNMHVHLLKQAKQTDVMFYNCFDAHCFGALQVWISCMSNITQNTWFSFINILQMYVQWINNRLTYLSFKWYTLSKKQSYKQKTQYIKLQLDQFLQESLHLVLFKKGTIK
jgi:hypothetical protein